MRKLNEKEKAYAKMIFENKLKKIKFVMNVFKGFGTFQILLIIAYIIFGDANTGDIPFMLIGCVLLYLVYFKFTNFLANKNQWKKLLEAIEENKEAVYECELVNAYKTSTGGSRSRAKVFIANVIYNGQNIRCNASYELEGKVPGTTVYLICSEENVNIAAKYVISDMNAM